MLSQREKLEFMRKISELKKDSTTINTAPTGLHFPEGVSNQYIENQLQITNIEVDAYIAEANLEFIDANISELLKDCRQQAIQAIITPLGLGKFVSLYDKIGGNVDTINNVRNSIYATAEEEKKYLNREGYDSARYHTDPAYKIKNRSLKEQREQGNLVDEYSGKKLDKSDLDHVISAKEINDDPGVTLAELNGAELANTEKNLVPTDQGINRSKKAMTMSDFIEYIEKQKEKLKIEINNLHQKEPLSENQQIQLHEKEKKLKKYEDLDSEKMQEHDSESRKDYNNKLNKEYYTSGKFIKNTVKTSGKEGIKMGIQQAIGLLLYDLTNALFDEVSDCYKNSFMDESKQETWWEALIKRCKRVLESVVSGWKKLIAAFRDGVISGFLSNLVTVIINTFFTTAKNIVRIIREGTFVLYQTAKQLLFPEKNMAKEEAWDAALKIFVTGAITLAGISLEECISEIFLAVPIPGKQALIAICVGLITGLSTAVVLYGIDKWDPFGSKDKKKRLALQEKIQQDWDQHIAFRNELCALHGISCSSILTKMSNSPK